MNQLVHCCPDAEASFHETEHSITKNGQYVILQLATHGRSWSRCANDYLQASGPNELLQAPMQEVIL